MFIFSPQSSFFFVIVQPFYFVLIYPPTAIMSYHVGHWMILFTGVSYHWHVWYFWSSLIWCPSTIKMGMGPPGKKIYRSISPKQNNILPKNLKWFFHCPMKRWGIQPFFIITLIKLTFSCAHLKIYCYFDLFENRCSAMILAMF